jgi:F-type H+-transporting ATPase subunit delta
MISAEAIMLKGAVGRRYAQAILELATEHGDIDRWLDDLRVMRTVLAEPKMAGFLENPKISLESKRQVIERGFAQFDVLRRNLIYLLISKHRTEIIDKVCSEFERLYNDMRGIADADVSTAVAVSDGETSAIAQRLSQVTGKQVNLRLTVDPSLIGGFVARIGDQLIDGSVKGRLTALRERLVGVSVQA